MNAFYKKVVELIKACKKFWDGIYLYVSQIDKIPLKDILMQILIICLFNYKQWLKLRIY